MGEPEDISDKDKEIHENPDSSDYNYNSYDKINNTSKDNDKVVMKKDEITLKRSTFYGLVVIGIISLLISAFLGGYTFSNFVTPKLNVVPSSLPQGMDHFAEQPRQNPILIPPDNRSNNGSILMPTIINNPVPAADDDPIRGNIDAKITLIEFSDYQCPFCKRFFDQTMPKIKQDYIETGKIKHVFRDYPLPIHNNAFAAALAAQCAQDQQKYWQYHDLLFERQQEWENQSMNSTILTFKQYSQELGMNANMFNQCLDEKKYQEEVNKDLMHGSVYGVSGTPTFYIGNEVNGYTQIVGAQPFPSFENLFRYYEGQN